MGLFQSIRDAINGNPTLKNDLATAKQEIAEMRASYQQAVSTGQGFGPFWQTTSGEKVNRETGMRLATWFACLQVRWDSVGMLPFNVFQNTGPNSKIVATKHPVYYLLHVRPNPFMTATQFWKTVQKNRDNDGNCFCRIIRNGGVPVRIDILPYSDVTVYGGDELYYEYKGTLINSSDMLHFKGYTFDGRVGLSLTEYHAETIGRMKAINRFSNRSISENPGMYATSQNAMPMGDVQQKAFKDYWQKQMANYGAGGDIPVLYNGFDLKTVGINPKDALYLDQIQATKEDIFAITKVPPKLAQNFHSGNTYSNSEQQGIDYLTWTLNVMLKDIEEECNYKLFSTGESEYFGKFNEKAILRTDAATQAAWMESMFNMGAYSINMILEMLDENPIEGGDDHFVPGNNLVPLRLLDQVLLSKSASGKSTDPAPTRARDRFADRMSREEIIELVKATAKNGHKVGAGN